MHRAVAAVLAGAALLVTGCGSGGSSGSGLPTVGATTTTAPTSAASTTSPTTPAPDASPWTALPTISEGPNKGVHNGVVLASSVAKTVAEREAVDAYVAYWKYLAKAGYEVKVDEAELKKIAAGSPISNIQRYVTALRKKKARTVGWASINVTSISAGENGVLLKSCIDNGSYDVDRATGKRLEKGAVAYDSEGGIRVDSGSPVVTFSRSTDRDQPCAGIGG